MKRRCNTLQGRVVAKVDERVNECSATSDIILVFKLTLLSPTIAKRSVLLSVEPHTDGLRV